MPRDTAPASAPGQEPSRHRHARAALSTLTAVVCLLVLALPLVSSGRSAASSELVRALPAASASVWPAAGQAAVAVDDGDPSASPGRSPVPTASTAKVMTAYVFLSRYPLEPGQPGPSFTVSAEEAARHSARSAGSESVVPLPAGQRMTEREALQALLAASANNVADELARWYGSDPVAFVAEMNRTAHRLGMDSTHYTGPSGLHSTTVSTAADQVRLFRAALRLPEFADLAGSSYTDVLGHRHENTNPLLGHDGVFAGKTGTTTAAGSNLVFAARRETAAGSLTVVGAVMHQPDKAALEAAVGRLIAGSLVTAPVIHKGEVLAWAHDGWGRSFALHAAHDLDVTGPPGAQVTVTVEPGTPPVPGTPAGTTAARAVAGVPRPAGAPHIARGSAGPPAGDVGLRTDAPLPRTPPLVWLAVRPWDWLSAAAASS
ncbi:D-alanyl-D-alanine carboxypeptidase family protein [Streptomyces sp. NPDC059104]|uniref:D-alanyl-D-alanine carboxypeptidase family protein n=1 Tax=Streptomyces sp. NPDC059104 TaxID=3346729 RepID=UPI0036A7A517